MKTRLLLVLLALPLAAFDCGGGHHEATLPQCPYGCRLQVRGAVAEDLCCVAVAFDYSQLGLVGEWSFVLSAFRQDLAQEAGAVGIFIEGRPVPGATYAWDGAVCSTTALTWGNAERVTWTSGPQPMTYPTHSADSELGTGALSLVFTEIPPPEAVGEQQLAVHGSLTGTLPADESSPDPLAPPVTFSAVF